MLPTCRMFDKKEEKEKKAARGDSFKAQVLGAFVYA